VHHLSATCGSGEYRFDGSATAPTCANNLFRDPILQFMSFLFDLLHHEPNLESPCRLFQPSFPALGTRKTDPIAGKRCQAKLGSSAILTRLPALAQFRLIGLVSQLKIWIEK
jgi:hypothetical protein